ncbi:hypothetical protein HOU41_gp009 [Proteus phage Stubb]|uniref:Uncharacterized protein n=1 Tax=Proteus phage Stubb TaxID=2315597 RepID=A0A3B8E0A7_9CAUD|nr:hypothetical protein HOU41_gp009 [Proteus phage Stubb]AYJ73149.1 hypothetical protein CPT_Stubb_009 [Proteus phage Stubb]
MKNLTKLSLTMPKFARYLSVAVSNGILSLSGAEQVASLINQYPQIVPLNKDGKTQDFPSLDFALNWREIMDVVENNPTAIDLDALIASVTDTAVAHTIKQLEDAVVDASDCLSKERQASNTVHKAPNVFSWLNHVFIANGLFCADMLDFEETFIFCMVSGCESKYEENCQLDDAPLYPDFFK